MMSCSGGAGDDVLIGGAGADDLQGDGGEMMRQTIAHLVAVLPIDLAAGTGLGGDAAGDTLSNIENVTGSSALVMIC